MNLIIHGGGKMRYCSIFVSVLILLAGVVMPGHAAEASELNIPDTPAGVVFEKLMDALNSGSEDQWTEFINNQWKSSDEEGSFERRIGFFRMLSGDLGGCEPRRVENSEEYSISVLTRGLAPRGPFEWVVFLVDVDSLPPHKVIGVGARPGEKPLEGQPEGKLTDKQVVDLIEKYIDGLVAEDRFSGAVLLAKNGEPLFKKAYGLASKRWNIPNKIDTKFNLGSMNKMFTGVAIAQLVEQGRLSFADTVGTYLPDCPNKKIASEVTIHQLLTHTSGMQDYWEELFDSHWWEIKTVDQLAALIYDDSLLFEPGTDFHYSNSGPVVLGQIIEKITGQDYYEYVREHIYEPAGMLNTDSYDIDRPVPNLAIGYTKETYTPDEPRPDGWRNNLFMHASKGGPAGGGFSTVEDLLRFDIALHNGTLLSKEYVDILTTGKVARIDRNMNYAYLFGDADHDGVRIIGHGGGAPGINSELAMLVDLGYTIAVMSNYDMGATPVVRKIEELLLQK